MKFTWKDIVTTALLIAGGAIVYAKFYNYSWAVIASWRSAVAVLAGLGVGMFAFSSFDFSNFSWLNMGEMMLGLIAAGVAVTAMIVTSSPMFYVLAAMLGTLWLVDTARHIRHSLISGSTTSFGRHVTAH